MPRFLVVEDAGDESELGHILEVFRDEMERLKYPVRPDQAGRFHEAHDGLILLGSGENSDRRASEEYFPTEAEWVRRARRDGKPVLGICHGAQLIASALGGQIKSGVGGRRVDGGKNRGGPVRLRPDDSDLADMLRGHDFWQNHWDYFELPERAERLADSSPVDKLPGHEPHCDAFRMNGNIYAFQFHPEAGEGWFGKSPSAASISVAGLKLLQHWRCVALSGPALASCRVAQIRP